MRTPNRAIPHRRSGTSTIREVFVVASTTISASRARRLPPLVAYRPTGKPRGREGAIGAITSHVMTDLPHLRRESGGTRIGIESTDAEYNGWSFLLPSIAHRDPNDECLDLRLSNQIRIRRQLVTNPEQLINEFSLALHHRAGAFFVGAGLSVPSGIPSWSKLLEPEFAKFGIILRDGDDLPLLAQHVVNNYAGNRGPLVNALRTQIGKHSGPNDYHRAIARTCVDLIWTTNYDNLLETALAGCRIAIRAHDSAIAQPADDVDIEIIKAHGCALTSPAEDLVLTQEDYEDFVLRRPATAQRLRSDLLSRTFLFIGYGYADPNIRNILVEARHLARRSTRRHFMIQRRERPSVERPDAGIRQELWLGELRRFGIDSTLIDDYNELRTILAHIASASRGRTLYVTGSHERSSMVAMEIGRLLGARAESDLVLLDGQSTGVTRDLISAYGEQCVKAGADLRDRVRLYPNPYAVNAEFSNDPQFLPQLRQCRETLLREARVVVVFDGGMGTKVEVDMARDLGCILVPVVESRAGMCAALLADPAVAGPLERFLPGYCLRALPGPDLPSAVVECILHILR